MTPIKQVLQELKTEYQINVVSEYDSIFSIEHPGSDKRVVTVEIHASGKLTLTPLELLETDDGYEFLQKRTFKHSKNLIKEAVNFLGLSKVGL
ncbi:MAG: hypothetical protein KF802_02595 [Bdellovibrionaceae bacterium]|nr:hypothetical protein [Pseudobdellovibrionaceae bacterium]